MQIDMQTWYGTIEKSLCNWCIPKLTFNSPNEIRNFQQNSSFIFKSLNLDFNLFLGYYSYTFLCFMLIYILLPRGVYSRWGIVVTVLVRPYVRTYVRDVRPSEIFFEIFVFLGSSRWQFLTIFSFFEKNDFLGLPRPFFDHFSDI